MLRKSVFMLALLASVGLSGPVLAADDPTIHQVYAAAEAGKLDEAQGMMAQVLRDHPNSAKAHFVEAELLAKQGRLANAQTELNTAERLAPGLPFAKPQAVQNLKARIANTRAAMSAAPAAPAVAQSGIPWGMVLIGLALIVAIVLFVRSLGRRSTVIPAGAPGYGPGGGVPYGGGMSPPMAPSGGMGSGILGGLATGAAVGAGMVAGEALAHHLIDGDRHGTANAAPLADPWNAQPDDMGGADFGVADGSSWDDGGGSSDDWS